MDSLMPNMDLLKSPFNWAFVAFSVVILTFISHIIFKETDNG